MKKTMKKLVSVALATVSVFGLATTMTACETSHPEVEIEIAFNGETYNLDYKLYRKTAPSTVSHFLWLAGNGYYDGLSVHDYDDDRLYTGAYTTSASDATVLQYKGYYDVVSKYVTSENPFPHSVWMDQEKKNPTYTLRGEFSANNVTVESGEIKESFGSLTMFYEEIKSETVSDTNVYTVRADDDGVGKAKYGYNSATSMFFISLTSSDKTNSNYCTFATIDEDSVETLKELQTAIADHIADNYGEDEDEFTEEVSVKLFEDNELFAESSPTTDYDVPKSAIVVKKVTVTKY